MADAPLPPIVEIPIDHPVLPGARMYPSIKPSEMMPGDVVRKGDKGPEQMVRSISGPWTWLSVNMDDAGELWSDRNVGTNVFRLLMRGGVDQLIEAPPVRKTFREMPTRCFALSPEGTHFAIEQHRAGWYNIGPREFQMTESIPDGWRFFALATAIKARSKGGAS